MLISSIQKFRRAVLPVAAFAVSAGAFTPVHAWQQNAHWWVSVGIFGRFNVVTRDDFSAQNSDMQCGFAAGKNANLTGGYTVGKSGVHGVGDSTRHQIGMLVGNSLNWTNASGTIDGHVFLGNPSAVTISAESPVTLLPGNQVLPVTTGTVFQAVTPELWVGWGADTVNWGYGSLTPNNSAPNATGWTGYTNTPLPGFFQAFYDQYLANMSGGMLVTTANGTTTVEAHAGGKNITLDGGNKARYDMPGNRLANGAPNTAQPGGRRAVYIFDVNAADLSDARVVNPINRLDKDEFGAPTWTVVKVLGAGEVTIANIGLQGFAAHNRRTVWVFDDRITKINLNAVAIEGTILARKAHVEANNGHINGSIIAKSFNGTLEGHCAPFESYIDP